MRKLSRAAAVCPANWTAAAQGAVPDVAAFTHAAQAFEALPLAGATRRAGFTAYAPGVLPKSKGKPYFKSVWGRYKKPIARISDWQCAYCECTMNSERVGQVEHFKPKSLFPLSAYDWDNYLLACGGCNGPKSDNWPPVGGYLRPDDPAFAPADHLAFDAHGEVAGITPDAAQTITDFDLKRQLLVEDRKAFIQFVQKQLDLVLEIYALRPDRGEVLAVELVQYVRTPGKMPYSTALDQYLTTVIRTAIPSAGI